MKERFGWERGNTSRSPSVSHFRATDERTSWLPRGGDSGPVRSSTASLSPSSHSSNAPSTADSDARGRLQITWSSRESSNDGDAKSRSVTPPPALPRRGARRRLPQAHPSISTDGRCRRLTPKANQDEDRRDGPTAEEKGTDDVFPARGRGSGSGRRVELIVESCVGGDGCGEGSDGEKDKRGR